MLVTKKIPYQDGDVILEAYCAFDAQNKEKKPIVLICHDWSGRNPFACQKAEQLAQLGYIGFAIDMYGKDILGKTNEEKSALMTPFMQNRDLLKQRLHAAYQTALTIAEGDGKRIAAIGFCFGGLCALDLARSQPSLKGVVSFHGLLNRPENTPIQKIHAKILALHGFDDPMVTPDAFLAFADEMNQAKADWQFHIYGHTKHAFTNPNANDPGFGTVYSQTADTRSWLEMKHFLQEVL